jgi:hypothetical protein
MASYASPYVIFKTTTNDWRMEILCKRWLDINEEIAYRKVLSCTKKKMVKILENFYSGLSVNGKGR